MPIPTIPTAATIQARIISDVEAKIGDSVPVLPKALIKVIAGALSGMFVLLYLAITWVYKQIFAQSAEYASLRLMGALFGITPTPATAATLLATITGSGSSVATGTTFSGPNGVIYKVTTTTTITAGTAANVPLLAMTAGEIGNLTTGAVLNITRTDLGLDGTATITSTSAAGVDGESKENFRKRVIARFRQRLTGGSPFDYWQWGMECPNFTWIGPYNDETIPNKIHVYGMVSDQTDGIPTAGELTSLASYLQYDPDTAKADRAPMGTVIECHAITRHLFDIAITIQDADSACQEAVEDAVTAYIESFEPYIYGVSDTKNDTMSVANVSDVAQDEAELYGATIISVAIEDHTTGAALPSNMYTFQGGTFGKVNSLTFTVIS